MSEDDSSESNGSGDDLLEDDLLGGDLDSESSGVEDLDKDEESAIVDSAMRQQVTSWDS